MHVQMSIFLIYVCIPIHVYVFLYIHGLELRFYGKEILHGRVGRAAFHCNCSAMRWAAEATVTAFDATAFDVNHPKMHMLIVSCAH